MKIIVDGFGGDNAPLEIIKGSRAAVDELGAEIIMTGRKNELLELAVGNNISLDKIELHDAPDVVTMEDDPTEISRSLKNSSMAVGLKLLADGAGDAFVSAGSTGALLVGSTLFVKRIKGVKRAALAPIMPASNGCYMLIDCGANVECRPEMLHQFAVMGSIYMKQIMDKSNPTVGLVNVGTENSKGGLLQKETFELLKNSNLHFIGNIEARDIPFGISDVVVCDGFTGNVILKLTEGVAMLLMGEIKDIFGKNVKTKLAASMVMGGLKGLKKKMDYNEYGGSPLLGIAAPVFKAHGSSKEVAFKNAIRQAMVFSKMKVIDEITAKIKENQGIIEEQTQS